MTNGRGRRHEHGQRAGDGRPGLVAGLSRLIAGLTGPRRGDFVAGIAVAMVLIPQSLAYAQIAGTPPVNGLYTAVAATLAGGLVGSSPYLQTGSTALTSLLTFGALAPLTQTGTTNFAAHAALLALVAGAVRLLLGLLRWGVLAYLMSQPVVTAFTVAAAILIVTSQIPARVDAATGSGNPFLAACQALAHPGNWNVIGLAVGLGTITIIVLGPRFGPRFPGALLCTLLGLGLSWAGLIAVTSIGDIPSGLPPLSVGLPWGTLGSLVLPGIVIALVGFAEPASIACRYASEDRMSWNPNKEFIGQGLANLASGMLSGYPAGGFLLEVRPQPPLWCLYALEWCPDRSGRAGRDASRFGSVEPSQGGPVRAGHRGRLLAHRGPLVSGGVAVLQTPVRCRRRHPHRYLGLGTAGRTRDRPGRGALLGSASVARAPDRHRRLGGRHNSERAPTRSPLLRLGPGTGIRHHAPDREQL